MRILILIALSFAGFEASAQDAKTLTALNNVQHEMTVCVSYYSIVKSCAGNQDEGLSVHTQKTVDVLTARLIKLGGTIGMTQDAMLSRLKTAQDEQQGLINNNCVNMSSLYQRHAARCKLVTENGDAVLDEYLKR
jgi:hypothetical protein